MSVRLTGFMVTVEVNQVQLHWKASSELNNDRFEIEKSEDGVRFSLMTSIQGKGTSINNCYKSIDHHPVTGLNYYRLKQVDIDGKSTILDLKATSFNSNEKALVIYPNPALDKLNLRFSPGFYSRIELIDMEGQYLQSLNVNAVDQQLLINLDGYHSGTYMLRLSSKKQFVYKSIIKV